MKYDINDQKEGFLSLNNIKIASTFSLKELPGFSLKYLQTASA